MFLAFVLDAEIINNERERNRPRDVFPQAWSVGCFNVTVWTQAFAQQAVGKNAGLGKAIHTLANFHVYVTFVDFGAQVVLIKNRVGNEMGSHAHIFVSVERSFEVEIFDVGAAVFRGGRGEHTVPM